MPWENCVCSKAPQIFAATARCPLMGGSRMGCSQPCALSPVHHAKYQRAGISFCHHLCCKSSWMSFATSSSAHYSLQVCSTLHFRKASGYLHHRLMRLLQRLNGNHFMPGHCKLHRRLHNLSISRALQILRYQYTPMLHQR